MNGSKPYMNYLETKLLVPLTYHMKCYANCQLQDRIF